MDYKHQTASEEDHLSSLCDYVPDEFDDPYLNSIYNENLLDDYSEYLLDELLREPTTEEVSDYAIDRPYSVVDCYQE